MHIVAVSLSVQDQDGRDTFESFETWENFTDATFKVQNMISVYRTSYMELLCGRGYVALALPHLQC